MKKYIFILSILISSNVFTQEKPKLVVGIVVDQMRYDYVYRFWNQMGDDGIKKLVNEGYFCRNNHFGYVPTYTGPGHASIFTGTTPSVHGIIGNNWYDKVNSESVYCAGDGNSTTICDCENHNDVSSNYGKMSPHRMLSTTIGDELKLFSPNSKVIGISLKDRGAILPAGHSANAAYWMDNNGDWISSDYYMPQLPEWLIQHQDKNPATSYFKGKWEGIDFEYDLNTALAERGPGAIKSLPQGNTILKDLAKAIVKNEELGSDNKTDFLSVSFSSTDYIGHQFGPHAEELVDTYIRLDKDIADLLSYLDINVGSENLIVFLTSDHGVVSVPNELKEKKIPAGYFDASTIITDLNKELSNTYGAGEWALKYSNQQIFLNHTLIKQKKADLLEIQNASAQFLIEIPAIKNTFTAHQLHHNEYQNSFHSLIQKGYNQKRSGDVIIALEPAWIEWSSPTGTTHGSHYSYDTHVPLIFWGQGITQGRLDERTHISDIAPTVCTLLGISFPNGCTGNPIRNITE
jgi:predicted AlkP superfamily pyrophosphatase or phosphodiesterase